MSRTWIAAGLLLGFMSPRQAPSVDTIPLYVTVLDRSGRFVSNLTEADFQIRENGKPVSIESLKTDPQTITVVVMLDTSGSMTLNLGRLQEAAEAFLVRLKPGDRARIGEFNDDVRLSSTFTGDRDSLLRTLHNDFKYGNGTKLWDAMDVSLTALSAEKGRRVLLVFTDGDDTTSAKSLDTILKRLRERDYLVYAIGLRSMMGMQETVPARGLKQIAAETGGRYFELGQTDDLGGTFAKVADELHQQYVLTIKPAVLDGKTHKIEIKVNRPGLSVVARRTYVAANADQR